MAFSEELKLSTGLIVSFRRNGDVCLEVSDPELEKDDFTLYAQEIKELLPILHNRSRSASNGHSPAPFPIVEAVRVEGANGPVAVVDLAGELARMAARNAELLQHLADLEAVLEEMRGE